MLRDDVIKLAHDNPGEVRDAILPVLAKAAGSRVTMLDIREINQLVQRNNHGEAAFKLAMAMGRQADADKLRLINKLAALYGSIPSELYELRYRTIQKPMYAAAKRMMVRDEADFPVTLYSLLD